MTVLVSIMPDALQLLYLQPYGMEQDRWACLCHLSTVCSLRDRKPRQAAGGRRQAAGGRRQAAGGRRQAAGGRRQAAGGWRVPAH
jgi:hypothetical protein